MRELCSSVLPLLPSPNILERSDLKNVEPELCILMKAANAGMHPTTSAVSFSNILHRSFVSLEPLSRQRTERSLHPYEQLSFLPQLVACIIEK